MHRDVTIWRYFLQSNLLIQCIFVTLLILSALTWVFILQRIILLKTLNKGYLKFEKDFWSDIKLTELYEGLSDAIPPEHLSAIFYAGFTEFCRLRSAGCQTLRVILEGVSRAMRIAHTQAEIQLEQHLHWLITIIYTIPYIGLIGTLTGVVSAISSLNGTVQPNTLLIIAPGIAESLIISIVSLVISLPPLLFYYSYTNAIDKLLSQYSIFQEEFLALLLRQAYDEHNEKSISN